MSKFRHEAHGDIYMFRRAFRRLGYALITGSILYQGCALNSDDLQLAAANSTQNFLSDLFAIALTTWIDVLFNVPA